MKLLTSFLVSFLLCEALFASDIKIEGVEWSQTNQPYSYQVKFTISWNNSWFNDKNHDAAWVFIKYQSPAYRVAGARHAKVSDKGHKILFNHLSGSPSPIIEVPADRTGFFIYPSAKHRGPVRWTIEISLDTAILRDQNFNANDRLIDVKGIEMVYIPQGSFTVGDPDTSAYRNYALFSSDGNGRPDGLYTIREENKAIPVGREKSNLFYNSETKIYQGDQRGPIPEEFPKGVQAFYIMKYELSQGQYAEFLTAISATATYQRANFTGKGYYEQRGSIKMQGNSYTAGSPSRPCNFTTWDDACAFADWSALRPMTELEFEKACRGTAAPIAHEYPWNTNNKNRLQRIVDRNDELVWINDLKESDLNESNRDQYGASYYWVMDLAGSLWERCVTIGDSTGRNFKGTHGDGMISNYGFANVPNWPTGSTETSGFGFKGGGYYEHNMQYGGFNPHGPIGYRNFGSWPGGARSIAYGSRFVRTVLPGSSVIR